jgi:lysyl-tRNA synthetase class 2
MKRGLRRWFEARDFLEVETSCLQVSPGNEVHLAGFAVAGRSGAACLATSPEFACKKLLAAGEPRIFTFAHAFRDEPASRLHLPEFIMLEWYRAEAGFADLLSDIGALVATAAESAGVSRFHFAGRTCDADTAPEHLTVSDAFARHAGIDLAGHLAAGADRDSFAALAQARGHRIAGDDDWADIFSKVITSDVEPKLGIDRPTLLTNYPVSEAALARAATGNPLVAERVELYICGVEVANGFAELTDADEQRRRFEADMDEMERRYGTRHPIDDDFLAAVAHMPEAVGCALGFDRLVMLAAGAPRISDVVWTPPTAFRVAEET